MEKMVCPWCQTEIVWDEEIGPEEQCPHCLNELGDYRSVPIGSVELDEIKDADEHVEPALGIGGLDEEELSDGELKELTAGLEAGMSGDLYEYEQRIKTLQEEQEDIEECPSCHEVMLQAGTTVLDQVEPAAAFAGAFKDGALKVNILMCPTCFRMHWRLAAEQRLSIIHHLSKK